MQMQCSAYGVKFERESLPWIQDLIDPFLAGAPSPLTDTVDPRALADADSQFMQVNGIDIHYKEYLGHVLPESIQQTESVNSGIPNLLMLHGFNASEFNWRLVAGPLADKLTAHSNSGSDLPTGTQAGSQGQAQNGADTSQPMVCRAVAYDRPPFGLSGRPITWDLGPDTDPFTLSGGVEIARGVAERLGLGRVVVMGHSAGAPIALEFAARHPHLVAGVVLVAPAVSTDSKGYLASADLGRLLRLGLTRLIVATDGPGLNYVRRQLRRREQEVRAGNLGVHYDNAKFVAQQEVIDNYLKPMRAHDWDKASLNVFRSSSFSTDIAWKDVQAPVLVVQGKDDTTVPVSGARAVVQALKNTRPTQGASVQYVELHQCGHVPMEEKPNEFIAAVDAWLATLMPADSTWK